MKHFYKKGLGILSLLITLLSNSLGQVSVLSGNITEAATGNSVGYAYIQNFSRQQTVYSNSKGNFKIEASTGDTLVLYSAGYLYKKVVVEDSMLVSQLVHFTLEIPSYRLDEARIIAIGSYNDLKNRIIDYDLPATQTEELNKYIADITINEAREAYLQAEARRHSDGFTIAAVPILTPEEIERKKLAKIVAQQQVKDQVYQKFNPMMVKKITGLTNEDVIIEFMVFCRFSEKYILEVNEYDLANRIAVKFELFQIKKQEEHTEPNPMNRVNELSTIFA